MTVWQRVDWSLQEKLVKFGSIIDQHLFPNFVIVYVGNFPPKQVQVVFDKRNDAILGGSVLISKDRRSDNTHT